MADTESRSIVKQIKRYAQVGGVVGKLATKLASQKENKMFLDSRGIDTRPMFYSFKHHKHLYFLHNMGGRTVANAEKLHKEIVMLPSYPQLTEIEINHITDSVKELAETK